MSTAETPLSTHTVHSTIRVLGFFFGGTIIIAVFPANIFYSEYELPLCDFILHLYWLGILWNRIKKTEQGPKVSGPRQLDPGARETEETSLRPPCGQNILDAPWPPCRSGVYGVTFPLTLFTRIPATLLQGRRIIIIIIIICIYNAVAPGPEKPSDFPYSIQSLSGRTKPRMQIFFTCQPWVLSSKLT